MENKLFNTILSFNTREIKKFKLYCKLNFLHKNDDLSRFMLYISSQDIERTSSLSKTEIHDYLYKKKTYNDLKIRHLLWLGNTLLEDFIVNLKVTTNKYTKTKVLANYYQEKELISQANSIIESGIEQISSQKKQSSEYYLELYQLQSIYYEINIRNVRDTAYNLSEIIKNLDVFYVVETLKYACILLSLKKISTTSLEQPFLQNVLNKVTEQKLAEYPIIRIYYLLYLVSVNEDDSLFMQYIQDLKQHEVLFSLHDLNSLYRTAINFCIKKSNQNISSYTKEAFELYLYAIEKGFLYEQNEINRFIFTNIVSLGIKLKEFIRTEKFIKNFAEKIDPEYLTSTLAHNEAKLYYAKNGLDKALKILLTNEFKDVLWRLNTKHLILKILFETKEFDLFKIHLNAFIIYVKRKSDIGYHKEFFTKVYYNMNKLYKLNKNYKKYAHLNFEADTPDIEWFNAMRTQIATNSSN